MQIEEEINALKEKFRSLQLNKKLNLRKMLYI